MLKDQLMSESKFILGDCFEYLSQFGNGSFDAIITDPPYLYLDHKLDAAFDEQLLFENCWRLLDKGLIVFFGRGESYFKWNYICNQLGFKFKEEIIWDKKKNSNPLNNLMRVHENIAVLSKNNAIINKVYINKIDHDLIYNPTIIKKDFNRLVSGIRRCKNWNDFLTFQDGEFIGSDTKKHGISIHGEIKRKSRESRTLNSHTKGRILTSISVCISDHCNYQHPTQKPLELIKRLIQLTTKEGDTILDPFAGSGTLAIAALETNRNYICIEQLPEYYDIAMRRIEDWHNKPKQQELELFDNEIDEELEREEIPKQIDLFESTLI